MYLGAMTTPGSVLEMCRDQPLTRTRVITDELTAPHAGEVLLAVERFGLSSNNISYALLGDMLGHWKPFPAAEGWGRVPAWGVARVLAADPSVAREGARFAGYMPMATHVLMQAESTDAGLRDTSLERAGMLPLYRELRAVDDDPIWREEAIDLELAMMPVEPLAALLDEDLRRLAVTHVVISSASSKTAMGLGHLLRERSVRVTGLSSPRGASAVAGAESSDTVLTYDDIDSLGRTGIIAYVDIAGDPEVTRSVHEHLGSSLTHSIGVGGSHLVAIDDPFRPDPTRPGPPVERYSVGQRQVELSEELGQEVLDGLRRRARRTLVGWGATRFGVEIVAGLEATRELWQQVAQGERDPRTVVSVIP